MARRLGFYLLLAPLVVWLGALLIIPHIDLFITSLQVKVRPHWRRDENVLERFGI